MKTTFLLSAVAACALSTATHATTLSLDYTPTSVERVVSTFLFNDLVRYQGVFDAPADIEPIVGSYDTIRVRISAGTDKKFVLRIPPGVDGVDFALKEGGVSLGFDAGISLTNNQGGGTVLSQASSSREISLEGLDGTFPTAFSTASSVTENGAGTLRDVDIGAVSSSFSDGVSFSAIVIEYNADTGVTYDSDGSNLTVDELFIWNEVIVAPGGSTPALLSIESTVIPLPAGVLLLGGALGGLAVSQGRKRRRQ